MTTPPQEPRQGIADIQPSKITEASIETIKAKMQEVDRAGREWELNWITGLNPKHPDFTKIVEDRLASLKGGDDE